MKKEIAFVLVVALTLLSDAVVGRVAGQVAVKTDNSEVSRNLESVLSVLRDLRWLKHLANTNKSPLSTMSFPSSSKNGLITITSKVETRYAVIYGCNGAEIPPSLEADFDKVFTTVGNYFNVPEKKKKKVVVWVMDHQTLQKMNLNVRKAKVAALYAPGFQYFFFCPEYVKEYYLAHELIHYFIDTLGEEVTTELAQIIIRQQLAPLVLDYQPQ